MTGEEMERAINFVLQQQAQFWAGMEELKRTVAELKTTVAEHGRSIATLTDLVGRLAQAEIRLVERMDQLVERMDQLVERMDQLAQAQRETDERLNAFITFVEKYISSRDGGQPPRPA